MKRILILTFLTLLLSFTLVQAVEEVGIFNPPAKVTQVTAQPVDIGVFWNSLANPMQGASIGLKVTTDGGGWVYFGYGEGYVEPTARGGAAGTALGWKFRYAGTDTLLADSVLVGGAYMPPYLPGLDPDQSSELLYHLALYFGDEGDWGQICIDSCADIPPGGTWLFDPGGPNTNPTFAGSGTTNSVCFPYEFQACQAPEFVDVPDGDELLLDHCVGGEFQFTAIPMEPGGTITGFDKVSGFGGIDGDGLYTVGPGAVGSTSVTVSVTNSCPQTTEYTFTLTYTNVGLEYTQCPTGQKTEVTGAISYDLGLDNYDCDVINETVVVLSYVGAGTGVPINAPTSTDGIFEWDATGDDVGEWVFEVTGNDGNGETDVCQVSLKISSGWKVRIPKVGEKPNFVYQGHYTTLPVYLDGSAGAMGGFDFLIAYDASALTFINAELGEAIDCWEYFEYRNGPFGNCDGACPTGMLRVVGMREQNDGPNHPDPLDCVGADGNIPGGAAIVNIKFYVTDDRTYECQFVPVSFFWLDCGDNAISDVTGEILYIAAKVLNYWDGWDGSESYYYLDPTADGDPEFKESDWEAITEDMHIYGAFNYCDDPNPDFPNKPVPLRKIEFYNGGIDIACADDIDARGDINLNNIPNEIADAVLYTNYFIQGPSVFTYPEGSIAASDVNNDGRVLTVGDLVYLIRILTGDAFPFTKLSPFAHEATVRASGDVVSINSPVGVGAALFVFDGEATVENLTNMDMLADVVDGQTRVLVYNIGTNSIDAGTNELVRVNGGTLVEAEVVDYNGNDLTTNLVTKIVPKAYALLQNYPNPFNPSTEVALELPEASNWNIDVYNVAGQLVKSYSGYSDAGVVKVNVDASGWASGIYFYKAVANNFVATKKMVLMK